MWKEAAAVNFSTSKKTILGATTAQSVVTRQELDDKRTEIRSLAQVTDFFLSTETTPNSEAYTYPYPTGTRTSGGKVGHKPSRTADVICESVPPLSNTPSHMTTR